MKKVISRNLPSLIITFFLTVSLSCSTGMYLKSEAVSETDMSGPFTLFLYSEYEEIKIAILDIEGDEYTLEMAGSPHNYVAVSGIDADTAVKSAVGHIYSQRNRWNKILAPDGSVIGFDFRARYNIFRFGVPDILDVSYRVEGKKVIVSVDIKHSIRKSYYRRLHGGN